MSSIWVSGEGEHRVVLTQTMHLLAAKPVPLGLAALAGRVARPYANIVGANSMFALPPRLVPPDIRTRIFL